MDVLQEKQVSAVFFVTMPYVKEDPDLIQRMIEEGHVVGNHTGASSQYDGGFGGKRNGRNSGIA
ncbi:MAG: polysaccharide deacetylase family protein [Clostridia bacterium]